MRKVEASKPNHLIRILPANAEHTCPKCKHKFYENLEKNEKTKKPFFRTDEKQVTIYEGEKNEKKDN